MSAKRTNAAASSVLGAERAIIGRRCSSGRINPSFERGDGLNRAVARRRSSSAAAFSLGSFS